MSLSAWLSLSLLGNPLMNWLMALGWMALVVVVVASVKPILIAWLSAFASRTNNRWDDALVDALKGTRLPLAVLVGLYPAVQNLTLPAVTAKWLIGLAAVGLFVQVGLWVSRFLDFWIRTSRERAIAHDPETATGLAAMSFIARLVLWSLVFLLLLDNLGFNVTTLLAGLGVGGIAVGLALQNILGDLFSSLSIVLDKPFQIGHFVVVDNFSGTVENIGLKTTRIRSISGEIVVFSNTDLTKARLRNYKFMQERRIVFALGVTYDTPPDTLEKIPGMVKEVIDAQADARFDRAHFKDFGDSSLNFEVVYWMKTADYTAYMTTQQAINLGLMRGCSALGVEFAFPTRMVHLQFAPSTAAASPLESMKQLVQEASS
ncbi:mechanosensitive ion channel family protein [Thiomonas bhubaneswarensis]|uniref:Small-conductance mechanosensitive channel n=1 Tax=Thiomonas bhubaneswarensis TaxID=339866 RepID=A0A0K6HR13_9BURK|nr:mechanosensitive ion channel family protein [Thiomonas bhubaneswarensis]CUA93360.1 Small-conductance mechanosensitive channel [Thiomonas bhubaneswarensis]